MVANKVMPRLLNVVRKTIEEQITADQSEMNAAERAKNPWLYQRLGLTKDKEEQALAVIRKKEACLQRAMEAASLTNEDDAAFNGLKPYQDELDEALKGLLGNNYETYQKLKDTYEQVTLGNARLPENERFTDAQAHQLADLMNEVYNESARGGLTHPNEEEDYDELMKRIELNDARIRQGAAKFLSPAQIDAVINPPADGE